jgi:hypothetical protein
MATPDVGPRDGEMDSRGSNFNQKSVLGTTGIIARGPVSQAEGFYYLVLRTMNFFQAKMLKQTRNMQLDKNRKRTFEDDGRGAFCVPSPHP